MSVADGHSAVSVNPLDPAAPAGSPVEPPGHISALLAPMLAAAPAGSPGHVSAPGNPLDPAAPAGSPGHTSAPGALGLRASASNPPAAGRRAPGSLAGELLERCTFPPAGAPLVCAVSGGADSLALLVLGVAAGCDVTAVHVDHGMRPGSAAEAAVVVDAARHYGVQVRCASVSVATGANEEERARLARRQALGPAAATGHTMDDQAETVIVNLLRGAGVDGLAAMRRGPGHPLLGLRRAETHALCAAEGLVPVHDPSNDDLRYLRNRIRHQLLPLCAEVAGRDVVPVLARQAGLLADESELLEQLAAGLDPTSAAVVASAPVASARRAVRRWLRGGGPHPPDLAAVERVLAVARGEAVATEVAGGRRVRRSGGRLFLAPGSLVSSEMPQPAPGAVLTGLPAPGGPAPRVAAGAVDTRVRAPGAPAPRVAVPGPPGAARIQGGVGVPGGPVVSASDDPAGSDADGPMPRRRLPPVGSLVASTWDEDPYLGDIVVDEASLAKRVAELGQALTEEYRGHTPLLVGVLKGAFVFLSDLARAVDLPVEFDVMAVASYGSGTTTSGVVRIVKDLDTDLTDRHVIVVEDIVDSGLTLSYLRRNLLARRPASLEICALLVKDGRQQAAVDLRHVGFHIPPDFVVGYGLDVAERYRNLPDIRLYRGPVADE